VAILEKLVDYIRAGSLTTGGPSAATTIPRKIDLLGHSMGSVISNALVASNPTIADGVILTGWGFDTGTIANPFGLTAATLQPKIASPMSQRWSSYDNGWFTVVDIFAYINAYVTLSISRFRRLFTNSSLQIFQSPLLRHECRSIFSEYKLASRHHGSIDTWSSQLPRTKCYSTSSVPQVCRPSKWQSTPKLLTDTV
jgi:pimeloyl-ACP methyl ester carboxylesterase